MLRAEQVRPVACSCTVLRSDEVTATLTQAFRERPDVLPIIGTAADGALADAVEPGVWEGVLKRLAILRCSWGHYVVADGIATRPCCSSG